MVCLLCGHNISSRWAFGNRRNHYQACVYGGHRHTGYKYPTHQHSDADGDWYIPHPEGDLHR